MGHSVLDLANFGVKALKSLVFLGWGKCPPNAAISPSGLNTRRPPRPDYVMFTVFPQKISLATLGWRFDAILVYLGEIEYNGAFGA